jgi:hypothetical protein
MEEIDIYIQKLKEEEEVRDFIVNGVYPKRLSHKQRQIYIPKLEEYPLQEINYNKYDIQAHLNTLAHNLHNVERELKNAIDKENNDKDTDKEMDTYSREINENNVESCPICIESIGERNYIVPSCGHKVCVNCFVKNMTMNRGTGCLCSLCRAQILAL